MKPVTRRSVMAGAAAVAAVPVASLGHASIAPELTRLIEEHRAAFDAFCHAIDHENDDSVRSQPSQLAKAERASLRGMRAEDGAFMALCSYRCRSVEEGKVKAEYLLSTSIVNDNWGDEEKALLASLAAA